MSAPKFTVERHEDAHRRMTYWIKRESGEVVCITAHADLARVIETHEGMVDVLERCASMLDCAGDLLHDEGAKLLAKRCWEEMNRARAALALARGES